MALLEHILYELHTLSFFASSSRLVIMAYSFLYFYHLVHIGCLTHVEGMNKHTCSWQNQFKSGCRFLRLPAGLCPHIFKGTVRSQDIGQLCRTISEKKIIAAQEPDSSGMMGNSMDLVSSSVNGHRKWAESTKGLMRAGILSTFSVPTHLGDQTDFQQ